MLLKYEVKTPAFEGPLDLLLNLIEKRKLFINDISLSKVTDDYLTHLKSLQNFPIPDSANFILVASTLVLIKSKSLLPQLSLTDEEEGSIADLEERLRVYKILRDAGLGIKAQFGSRIIFPKSNSRSGVVVFSPANDMSLSRIISAMKDVLSNLPKKEMLSKAVVKKVISLEEMITTLTSRIKSSLKMSFKEFSRIGKEEKINVIVSFLAMLELVKQGIIDVTQNELFEDIHMETQNLEVPRYNSL